MLPWLLFENNTNMEDVSFEMSGVESERVKVAANVVALHVTLTCYQNMEKYFKTVVFLCTFLS